MRGVPGTSCTLFYDCDHGRPDAGDFVRTDAGSCYRIDAVRASPSRPHRSYLTVTRLERDAVRAGAPGVWSMRWHRRT